MHSCTRCTGAANGRGVRSFTDRFRELYSQTAEYALGLGLGTGGTYTAAALTTKAGFKALIKTVAVNYVVDQIANAALTPVMSKVVAMAARAGVSPTLVRAGVLGLQGAGALKAAKGKLNTGPQKWDWNLNGKKKPSNLTVSRETWTKADDATYAALNAAFPARRTDFLKSIAKNNETELLEAGLSPSQIKKLKLGELPDGYAVHHKRARRFGGSNEDGNLLLIKQSPYHDKITGHFNSQTSGSNVGQPIEVEGPMFEGMVIYSGKE